MLIRNKVLSHAILILLLISAFPLVAQMGSENASADSPEVWNQTSGNLASTDANWLDGTKPIAGDNIIFNSTSTASCTWDLALALGSFTTSAGYTGVITQTASFSVTSFTIGAGTFTPDVTKTLTVAGNLSAGNGMISDTVLNLIMTGTGTTYESNNYLMSLRISGSTTALNHIYYYWDSPSTLTVDAGCTLTLNAGLFWRCEDGARYINSGIITGNGILSLSLKNRDASFIFGTVNSKVSLQTAGDAGASRTFTLGANAIFGKTLTILSNHVANTCTLDLSASNYALSATDITIGTRGILNGRASTITCSGNWDSSAGTFTAGTSTLVMSGSSKTIKTANANGAPYNFQESGTTTTSSSINITHSLTVDTGKTLTIGAGKIVDLNCSNGGSYSNLGTIAGPGTMEYSFSTQDKLLGFGIVNAPVRIRAISTSSSNRTLTTTDDTVFGSTLLVNSDHASYWMTLNAQAVYLGATGVITEGTRGEILYALFNITSMPVWGTQTSHSYQYNVTFISTTSGESWTITTNATWIDFDPVEQAVYGTPDAVFGGHWYWVNITITKGMLETSQNYTILVVPIETMQEYIPLLLAILLGFGLLIVGLKYRDFWFLGGPVWIICGLTIFISYGVVFLVASIGLGMFLMIGGVMKYA